MSDRPLRLTMKVVPEDGHWVALVQDVSDFRGGVTGGSLVELHEEAEAVKHFALNVPKETPVAIDYVYEIPGVAVEVLDTYRHLRAERDDVAGKLSDAATTAVAALRGAGLSVRDSAALLGLSRSRVDQLSHTA
jgi:hypothetical protein